MKKLVSLLIALSLFPFIGVSAAEGGRYMENLDRGLAAMRSGGIYLSWRLLGTEDYDTAFEVYKNGSYLATVSDSTNYTDTSGTVNDYYSVSPEGGEKCGAVKAFPSGENYFDIPLSQPPSVTLPDGTVAEYTPWDASVGDCDGDGEYEIIQRWDAPRHHAGESGYTGGIILDCYKLDGTVLWRIDLGVNIRCNTEQGFSVYDYNSDGICEIVTKTAPGSIDGTGRYVSEASLISDIKNTDNSADYRNSNGTVLSGPEYYTIFDGRNGQALDTIYYPIPRGEGKDFYVWGDNYGHRSEKYFDVAAYLDGVHPYIVTWRGIYSGQSRYGTGRTAAAAFRIINNRFSLEYSFDTLSGKAGYKQGYEKYVGQGNHNISVGDADNDGKDEIISGNLCLDDDLSVLWCSGRGHGDAEHLGNYDPTTEGLEYMTVHEDSPYGMTVYNAATGEELFHVDNTGDTGRGVMANVGSGGYYQVWGAGTYQSNGGTDFTETNLSGQSYNYRIFWDGDIYDELLDASDSTANHTPVITSYNPSTGRMEEIFRAYDSETINNTKSTPALTADILGDWREEVIAVREDCKALRVFVTDIPTENKLYTLMHDSQYRQSVAWQNEYYNQPPHVSMYLSPDGNDDRSKKPDIQTPIYTPTSFEAAVAVESGSLSPAKEPNGNLLIDFDGDYYRSFDYIATTSAQGSVGGTALSLSGKRYAYLAAANPHHTSVRLSSVSRKDGKFAVFAANNDSSATLTVSGKGALLGKGKLHLDFAIPADYSNDGLRSRGGNDVSINIGEISLLYSRAETALYLGSELLYDFDGDYDAQDWSEIDIELDCAEGSAALTFTHSGEALSQNIALSKNSSISAVSFTTSYWGAVMLDNLTLSSTEGISGWYSTDGFTPHYFPSVSGTASFDMDITPLSLSDGVLGFSASAPSWYSDLNIALRTTSGGVFEAYNGSGFTSSEPVYYSANKTYHLRIEADIENGVYSAFITDEDGNTKTLASSFLFRSSAPAAASLDRFFALGGDGVDGGKFIVTSFASFNSIPASRLDNAVLDGNTLTLHTTGSPTVYAALTDEDGSVLSYIKCSDITTIDKPFAYLKLYIWDDTLSPLSEPRFVR